ncbi:MULTISPECIES: ANR family transcriptional regulator [Pantoea]
MSQVKSACSKSSEHRYYILAAEAAFAENSGEHDKAVKLWLRSVRLAKNRINAEWAENRSQYCLSALRNGWSHIKNEVIPS